MLCRRLFAFASQAGPVLAIIVGIVLPVNAQGTKRFEQIVQLKNCATEGADASAEWKNGSLTSLEIRSAASYSHRTVRLNFYDESSGFLTVRYRYRDDTKLVIETEFTIRDDHIVHSGMIGMDFGSLIDEILSISSEVLTIVANNPATQSLALDCSIVAN